MKSPGSAQVLDLAPVCTLPPRDGAARRVWHLFEGLRAAGVSGTLVTADHIVQTDGSRRPLGEGGPWRRRKALVALVAGLSGQDYWALKMLTPAVRRATSEVSRLGHETVLLNFLYAWPLVKTLGGQRARLVIDTHNYDKNVFGDFRAAARNPLQRMLCARAIRNSGRTLSRLPSGTVMVHVSENDQASWRKDRPDLRHELIENGCTLHPRSRTPSYNAPGPRHLVFVGSLSAQMNQDALGHLAKRFWPSLREHARLTIAGSRPPTSVVELCRREGWQLRADLSEPELDELYESAHFAVLPFGYGAGSKLKLFEALGRAVPVLTTSAGRTGVPDLPGSVHVSDEPESWRATLQANGGSAGGGVDAGLAFARRHSWDALGARLAGIMQSADPITLPG